MKCTCIGGLVSRLGVPNTYDMCSRCKGTGELTRFAVVKVYAAGAMDLLFKEEYTEKQAKEISDYLNTENHTNQYSGQWFAVYPYDEAVAKVRDANRC